MASAECIPSSPSIQLPFTGLYCERVVTARPAALVQCSVEASLDDSLISRADLGLLFQNATERDFEDAIFHCRLVEDAAVKFFEGATEKGSDGRHGRNVGICDGVGPRNRFERKDCSGQMRYEDFYQCNIGRLQGGNDAVVFLRYVAGAMVKDDTVRVQVPLPRQLWKSVQNTCSLSRSADNPGDAVVAESREFRISVLPTLPSGILDIQSDSHTINPHVEKNAARIEVNEPVSPGAESLKPKVYAENAADVVSRARSEADCDGTEYSDSVCYDSDAADQEDTDISEPEYASLSAPPYQYTRKSSYDDDLMEMSFLWPDSDDEEEEVIPSTGLTLAPCRTEPALLSRRSLVGAGKAKLEEEDNEVGEELEEYEEEDIAEAEVFTATPVSPIRAKVIDIPRRSSNASSISALDLGREGSWVNPKPRVNIIAPTPKISAEDDVNAWISACEELWLPA